MKLFEGPGLIIILAIVLIVLGPKQLPELGKSLGKTMKSIKDGMEDEKPEATKANESTEAAPDADKAGREA